jgi:hypothetical protein
VDDFFYLPLRVVEKLQQAGFRLQPELDAGGMELVEFLQIFG